MKRSNRLVLLVGVFLAIVAFVGIAFILTPRDGQGPTAQEPTTQKVVVAANPIALGSRIQTADVKTIDVAIAAVPPNSFQDPVQVVGQTARASVLADEAITRETLGSNQGQCTNVEVAPGRRAMSVQVDQVTGVGTVIKAADYVDMLVGFTADKFPVVQLPDEDDVSNTVTVVSGLNGTSVKVLLQGMQVLCTLLPPPPAQTGEQPATGETPTTLTGQQQIVILSVTAQQAEIIKFAQMDGNLSLILRNGAEFLDPATNEPLDPAVVPVEPTTGIILRILVDDYGVLVPELVEAILPEQGN